MNSVLQVLTHTVPLAEVALHGPAPASSNQPDDPLDITLAHIKRALHLHSKVLQPKAHARTLRIINKRQVCARSTPRLHVAVGKTWLLSHAPP